MAKAEEAGTNSPKYPITELSDSIWWRETHAEFGLQRSVMLIGWAALLGASPVKVKN